MDNTAGRQARMAGRKIHDSKRVSSKRVAERAVCDRTDDERQADGALAYYSLDFN